MAQVCKATLTEGDWQTLISFENLYLAYLKAQRGKQKRTEVANFALRLEHHLWQLRKELKTGTYQPGDYRQFHIYERKPRTISVAPFRDRVVHHALMNLLEPVFEHHMIPHSYACRVGKGVHKAVDQYQRWAKRYPYVLKLDISRYFPSIDHDTLNSKLKPLIQDSNIQRLVQQIIVGSPDTELTQRQEFFPGDDLFTSLQRRKGLPIGNLTSQWFANWYLHALDFWVIHQPGMKNGYLRYVDDLFLFHDDKSTLWQLAQRIGDRLQHHERLRLHPLKTHVRRCTEKVDVLGYQVSRHRRWLRNENGYRFQRRLKQGLERYAEGRLERQAFQSSLASRTGHAQHGETQALRKRLFQNHSKSFLLPPL